MIHTHHFLQPEKAVNICVSVWDKQALHLCNTSSLQSKMCLLEKSAHAVQITDNPGQLSEQIFVSENKIKHLNVV